MKKVLIVCLIIFHTVSLLSQSSYHSTNKKAIKIYQDASEAYKKYDLKNAESLLLEVIEKDENFIEALTLLAYINLDKNNAINAKKYFQKTVLINKRAIPNNLYFLGELELKTGNYNEAKSYFEDYLGLGLNDENMNGKIRESLVKVDFAIEEMKNPREFKPINLGPNINSEYSEYFPSITVDQNELLITRRLPYENSPQGFNEDFYLSKKENNDWTLAQNIGMPINTQFNEGAPTLSADGQVLIFTACELYGNYGGKRKGYGSCDLFYSQRRGDNWSEPQNMGPNINSKHWETQPSFSSDGRTLYFIRGIRDRSGNRNGNIYVSQLDSTGYWSKPIPLNNNINTPANEESVFIHPDNQTLYFASDGHPGFGGLDIFMSKKDESGDWGKAVNLGYPINTYSNENSLLVSAEGKLAYFASNRPEGLGELDLYEFTLPKDVAPEKATYFAGKIYDSKTKEAISARFELIDLESNQLVVESFSDATNGKFLITLVDGKDYALNVSKDGYLFYSDNFSLSKAEGNKPYKKNVPLQKIEIGKSIVLKNIFFETAKYDLKNESKAELNKLVEFLNQNANIKIEISGHTDNIGSESSNKSLSINRAESVVKYLSENGINKSRIETKGFGSTKPLDTNDTAEGRAKNRRTEFKIISL